MRLQLGDAAGRASAAWAELQADSKQDSSSLFLGERFRGGLGVYQLLFIHELKGNYTYFGDNYDIYTNLVQIIGYACKMKDSSDLLEVGFRWIIMEEGCFILN